MSHNSRKRVAAHFSQSANTTISKSLSLSNVAVSTPSTVVDPKTEDNAIATAFEIPYINKNIFCTSFGAPTAQLSMIFTHGAGGDIKSPAVVNFAGGFSESKKVLCFQGNMNLQSRIKMFKAVMERERWSDVLGGRSLGARAAAMTAKETNNVKALILVSYPLRNEKGDLRDQLLLDINEGIDVLFVIGDKDSMCDLDELRKLTTRMKVNTWIIIVNNANHQMEMRPKKATEAIGKMTGRVVAGWLQKRTNTLTNFKISWDEEQNEVVVGPWSDAS